MLNVLVWLLAFLAQAGLLGIVMYSLISLSDLENDFVNPHDASAALNKWVPVEYILNAALAAFLLVCGKWIAAAIHTCVSLWNLRTYLQRDHAVDVTEIFRQLPKQKMMRMIKLVIFLFAFVLIIYRLVESAVTRLLTEEGRDTAKQLLKDAAVTF
ncbi:hypothetical protein ABBQ32_004093 [Trebouxia sp. C0010 RCD-2024]